MINYYYYLQCEPLHGWGFRRGGYQCRCRPGWRLPTIVRRPFLGEVVERATDEQYSNEFDCMKIGCKFEYKNQVTIYICITMQASSSKIMNSLKTFRSVHLLMN